MCCTRTVKYREEFGKNLVVHNVDYGKAWKVFCRRTGARHVRHSEELWQNLVVFRKKVGKNLEADQKKDLGRTWKVYRRNAGAESGCCSEKGLEQVLEGVYPL